MSEENKIPTPNPTPATLIPNQQPPMQPSTPNPTPVTPTPTPLSNQQPPPMPNQQPQQKSPAKSNSNSIKISLLMYLLGIISGIGLTLTFPKLTTQSNPIQPNPTPMEKMTLPTATPFPITPTLEASNSAIQKTTPEASPSANY